MKRWVLCVPAMTSAFSMALLCCTSFTSDGNSSATDSGASAESSTGDSGAGADGADAEKPPCGHTFCADFDEGTVVSSYLPNVSGTVLVDTSESVSGSGSLKTQSATNGDTAIGGKAFNVKSATAVHISFELRVDSNVGESDTGILDMKFSGTDGSSLEATILLYDPPDALATAVYTPPSGSNVIMQPFHASSIVPQSSTQWVDVHVDMQLAGSSPLFSVTSDQSDASLYSGQLPAAFTANQVSLTFGSYKPMFNSGTGPNEILQHIDDIIVDIDP